ncbi:ISAon1 family transposase N-terminal region protein [Runella aurantiaca]|uniref:ISAon1 family transposase N-terminal region protein n=1 Tax=Runella aurantiaca TaxID=2282308 RepID=UPI0026BA5499
MQESYLSLVRFLLPEGILDYFELSKIVEGLTGLHIYLQEKNLPPGEYKDYKLESKGFLPEIYIQDFPIRNHRVTLCIKRRRWEVKATGEIISRDWNVVQQGTRMTKEFARYAAAGFFKRTVLIITLLVVHSWVNISIWMVSNFKSI